MSLRVAAGVSATVATVAMRVGFDTYHYLYTTREPSQSRMYDCLH